MLMHATYCIEILEFKNEVNGFVSLIVTVGIYVMILCAVFATSYHVFIIV